MSKLSTEQRNKLTDSDFGIPEKRMYPLHDKAHVESAVKLFGHAETKYKKSLARKILSRAREYGMDTSGWKQVLTFAQEQVPPMSDGTSVGNSPPRMMTPYYDEQDELLERVNDLDGAVDPFVFAKRIVSAIHDQVEKDSKPPTGNQNCQLCTWCAEAWYRNMQVLPRPVYSPRDPALEIKGETIVMNPIKKRFSSQREVVETVRGNIDSRWYVHVNWKDSAGGHEFLVVNIKDYAYIMDAQAGLLKEIDETDSTNSYFRDINFDNSYMVRLDDKPFNTRLFNEMNDPAKVLPWKNALDIPYMRDNGMINDSSDDDPRFRRVMVPSDEATKYMKQDPELSQYWEELNKATTGEFLVDRETGEPIGHVFVHTNAKDKGFIFNLEVNPKYRRQGYGWILTDDAVRRLGGEDLTVDADNIPAINLYKQYGFEVYEKGQWHYDPPKDELWMKFKNTNKEPIQEAACTASLLNVKNQLTRVLGPDFEFIGGSMIPKFTIKSKEKPNVSFEVNVNGQNIEVTPAYNGIPDMLHKRRGIAIMRAANIIADFVHDIVNRYKPVQQESFMDEHEKRVNDKGDPVPDKCKCGGKISITLKGEPIYSCESCGKYYGTVPCNVQEGANIRDNMLVPVKDFKYNKVYYGDPTNGGSVRKLDDKPLFVTPHMGLASIFVGRRHIFHKLSEMGYREVNLGYDEWASTPDQPLSEVHVYVRNAPNLKPFTVEFDGYLHTIDCSELKDNIYRYPWMSDIEHEVLIAKVPEVKIDNVQKMHVRYYVRGIEGSEPSSHVQEGAFQDLKNGVNPYSDDLVFHVSLDKHIDGQIWKPRVPDYLDPYNPEDTGFEDNTTPRICFSTSIEGALNGITVNLQRQSPDTFDKMYVYVPEKPWKEYKHKTNKQLVKDKLVYDANVTREVWIMEPVRMKLYGVIRVDQIADAKRKSVVPTSKGQKDKRNYFTYKWHWVVKPKVLKKATKFDYSPERVIDDICVDVKKFKYGLIKDGRLMTGNVSDADYDKYWVFHSGETVDQAGGGNCYDMVEYEAGYLDAFGVPYKKYFMNFTDTKNTKTVNTHTICVVPHNGKFIYIEQAFKRVVDEWGYERKKVFDKLIDIFEYVAEVTAEYENQDLNYGVWDYTNAEIDYGTPIKNFQEWIMSKCKMIHDGEAKMNGITEEMDMFITIGDSMFYVSEYHNALFDDPDAVEEATTDYGIIIDDSEEIFDEAAKGPYDEYLRLHGYDPKTNTVVRRIRVKDEHGYDPKTNTIIDPNDPTKRVSATKYAYDRKTHSMIDPFGRRRNAGRMGSAKERNRMNKFLRDNDYDPYTSTIATDIPAFDNPDVLDKYKEKDGSRLRIPFTMNPHKSDQYRKPDTFEDVGRINLTPKTIQGKPAQSNFTLKHEEGHASQHNQPYEYSKRRRLADDFIDSIEKDKIETAHDLSPKEYDADQYGVTHNKYDKTGKSGEQELLKYVRDYERWLKQTDRRLKLNAKKYAKRSTRADQKIIDILKKYPNNPGPNGKTTEWEKFLYNIDPNGFQGKLKDYIEYWTKCRSIRKEYIAKMKEIEKRLGTNDSDEYDELTQPLCEEMVDKINEIKKEYSQNEMAFLEIHRYIARAQELAKLENMDNWLKTKRDEIASDQFSSMKKEFNKDDYRDPEEMKYAHKKRGEFAKQQWDELQKQKEADATKKRQLAKEQLKQQIDSGKLTKEQQEKAQRKIQRIEAFEAKKGGKVEQPTPTIKKEGYRMDRFGNRFFTEAKDDEMLSDDMEDITIGDLNLEDDEEQETETKDTKSKQKDDESLPEEGDFDQYRDEHDDERIEKARGPIDDGPMDEVPSYLKDRMSEEDLEDFEQPDENISARDVDLGQFGKDQSDVQNDFDPKEVTILMKLMASEADAMNEYMDGAKETNVDVLRRLYADIANEERFHMEQLLFAKCELTGEQYQPKDPEVKSEYEELLKMGMDEETAMQTAVDKCHIRGSISEDDDEERVELQADVETMEMQINMFNALYDQVITEMESGSAEDVNHAYDVFIEATYDATAASSETSPLSETQRFGPLKLIRDGLRFLIKTLMMLIRKFASFCKRLRNRSRETKRFIKNYGWEGLFDNKYRMYFVDFKDPKMINDSVEYLLTLTCDTMNAALKTAGIQDSVPSNLARNPRMDIHGNVKRGIELLNGVQLIKSPMVLPKDGTERERIAEAFFGYNEIKGNDAKSINVANSLQIVADDWIRFLEMVDERSAKLSALVNHQTSIYYTNKKQYDLAVKGLETVTKTCKAMVTALQNDINVVMKLNNEAAAVNMKDTNERDKQDMAEHGYYTTLSQNYEKNYRRVPDRFNGENK